MNNEGNPADTSSPAFPVVDDATGVSHQGVTMRDYFAAKAMQAHISTDPENVLDEDSIARYSYYMADAMLVERMRVRGEDE